MLIVAAEPFELRSIGNPAGWSVRKVAGGPGPKLAAAVAAQAGRADVVVSTGLCGALDPALAVGDIFVAATVNGEDCELPSADVPFEAGALVSQDRVAATPDEKRLLAARTGARAVEMEAAAVRQYARSIGARFYCIRAVSDLAGESFPVDLNAARDTSGRFRIQHILGQALRRPFTAIPGLIRLSRNARQASRALGDFFAHCNF